MIARYGRAGSVGQVVGGRRASFMWREVGRYMHMALTHTRWLIGDGRSIDVMEDPWVDALPLRLWPTMISDEETVGLRVYDLFRPGEAGWDEDRLGQLFGEHLAERVRALPVPGSAGPDVRVWSTTCTASVRVGDVSRVIQQESELGRDCGWVWRFGLHQRVALFLWKVAWDRLPTSLVLSRRGVSIPPLCPSCETEESTDHVLFQCVWAQSAWRLSGLPEAAWRRRDYFLEEVRGWSGSHQMRSVAIRASCIVYQIWLARNARVFGEPSLSPRFVMERARAQAAEILQAGPDHRPLTAQDIWGSHAALAASHTARHIYREANGAADWVASYVANHSGSTLWVGVDDLPGAFRDLLFADSAGCIRTRVV
ncbi:uncharacterized protein LOC120105218 [Phoenix dactylifera]|uniref:Uncharacterized protein LOC120105218 n=1 Tax=Phoenix dactylifera TaxID=42345 RepID=A0A8B8ZGX7_PHODC|nr:uncharacterized protein LOC120105218 [Phoenix dactylifera]